MDIEVIDRVAKKLLTFWIQMSHFHKFEDFV